MLIYLKDGTTMQLAVSPEDLYQIYKLCEKKVIVTSFEFTRRGVTRLVPITECIDEDLTFRKVIEANFPSLPPDVPASFPPDTEGDWMLGDESDCGDDGDIHRSAPPRSDTMPCRER